MNIEKLREFAEECNGSLFTGHHGEKYIDGDNMDVMRFAGLVRAEAMREAARIAGDNYGWRGDSGVYVDNLGDAILAAIDSPALEPSPAS